MFAFKPLLEMPRKEAFAVAAAVVAAMGYTIIALGWLPHMTIIAAITALLVYGLLRGLKYEDMQRGMVASLSQSMGAVYSKRGNLCFCKITTTRSEERRVGKECRSRWSPYH